MGVTIHYEGRLRSPSDFEKLIRISTNFATQNGIDFQHVNEAYKRLLRIRDAKESNYTGPVKGLILHPGLNCEWLNLEFDKDYYCQDSCKTQFADIEVHIGIIELLKQLEPLFEWIKVVDDGEYYETGSFDRLEEHIEAANDNFIAAKSKNPHLIGPVKGKNGRIIDLLNTRDKDN